MKSFFSRKSDREKTVPKARTNRVLTQKEITHQQEKLQTQRNQEAARKRAILDAQKQGPRNHPKPSGKTKREAAKPSLWKRLTWQRQKSNPSARKAKQKKNAIGPVIRDLLSGEFLTKEGVTRHIPYLLFISGLFVAYIAMGYQFERIEREKRKTKENIEELSAEFKTLQADFESRLQQSSIERSISALGLIQPETPPFLLENPQPLRP